MDKNSIKQKEYEIGLEIRRLIESSEFKKRFVLTKDMIREMYETKKSPKELLNGRQVVSGYGFVREFIETKDLHLS